MLFCIIYATGMFLLTCSAGLIPAWSPLNNEDPKAVTSGQSAALFMALYIIALGTGGIKPNVSSFGADQFDPNDPVAMKQKQSFFNYFYSACPNSSARGVRVCDAPPHPSSIRGAR